MPLLLPLLLLVLFPSGAAFVSQPTQNRLSRRATTQWSRQSRRLSTFPIPDSALSAPPALPATSLDAVPPGPFVEALRAVGGGSPLLLAASEGWRQYVPLAVSALVILDILLGSPAANLILAPMRRATEAQNEDVDLLGDDGEASADGGGGGLFSLGKSLNPDLGRESTKDPKERVDTENIARDALDRARGMLELREYLDTTKSDEQRFVEMRRKLDRQMEEFDSK